MMLYGFTYVGRVVGERVRIRILQECRAIDLPNGRNVECPLFVEVFHLLTLKRQEDCKVVDKTP